MAEESPDSAGMHSPLARLLIGRLAEMGCTPDQRTRPRVAGGPSRSTMNRYTQPGVWLRSGLRAQTITELAAAAAVEPRIIFDASTESIRPDLADRAADSVRPTAQDASYVASRPGFVTIEVPQEIEDELRRYAEFLAAQNKGGGG